MRNIGGGVRWEAHRKTWREGGAGGKGRSRTDERDIIQDESIGFCDTGFGGYQGRIYADLNVSNPGN